MISVIAIADCRKFTNDSHRLLFHRGSYGRRNQLHMITYPENVKPMKVIEDKCHCCGHYLVNYKELHFEDFKRFSQMNNDILKNLNNSIIDELNSMMEKRLNYMCMIAFGNYYIWYHGSGGFAVFDNETMYIKNPIGDTTYQSGDCVSKLYTLDNGDLLIVNDGDVTSSLLFSINDPALYQMNNIHESNLECLLNDCDLCQTLENIKPNQVDYEQIEIEKKCLITI